MAGTAVWLLLLPGNSSAILGAAVSGSVPVACRSNRSLKHKELASLLSTSVVLSGVCFLGWFCLVWMAVTGLCCTSDLDMFTALSSG